MSDLISRQDVIDVLNKMKIYRPLDSDRYVISDCLNKIVNLPSADTDLSDYSDRLWKNAYERGKAEGASMPSAEPERKKGHWIKHRDDWYSCSLCEAGVGQRYRFCPGCGADMRGGEDDWNTDGWDV